MIILLGSFKIITYLCNINQKGIVLQNELKQLKL
jgi:hypothetical protein|nr:MAG TPA: hypothetical protein [Ackermannviridae sp.]